MSWVHDVLLLRHPRPDVPPGHCYGQWDVPAVQPLDPVLAEVLARLPALTDRPVGQVHLFSSPLQRAQALAQPLAGALGWPLHLDPRWQELNFGAWEGRAWTDIPRHESDAWAADVHHRAPPGGETQAQLRARVHAALTERCRAPGLTLGVSHAGPIRCAVAVALGLPADQVPDVALDFGRLTWLRWHGGDWPRWQVQTLNR